MKIDKLSQDLLTEAVDQLSSIQKITTEYKEKDPCYLLGVIAARTEIYTRELFKLARSYEREDSDRE